MVSKISKNQGIWLTGRLTKDATFKRLGSNQTANCKFTVAVDRDKLPDEDKAKTDFPTVACWRKLAEKCEGLPKGATVLVLGTIQTGSYDNRNGDKVYFTEVLADKVFTDGGAQKKQQRQEESDFAAEEQNDFVPVDEDELPF